MKRGEMKTNLYFVFISLVVLLAAPLSYPKADSIYTKVTGDSVIIWHLQSERNCDSKFLVDYELYGSYIKVIEYDTSYMAANCHCNFDLSVTLGSLSPGAYSFEIFGVNIHRGDTINYGTAGFTIDEKETGKLSEMQSDCYFAADKALPYTPLSFYPGKDSLYAEVNGYNVKLRHDHLIQNCASRFIMNYEKDGNYIKVIELDTTMFRYDCICEYDLMLELGPLDPGSYIAEFIGRGVLEADSFSYGSIDFEITYPEAGTLKLSQYQSACKPFTSVPAQESASVPDKCKLYPAYPNPFNPSTVIRYSLPESGHIKIIIYDLLGREVFSLVDEYKSSGNYEAELNGNSLTSGIYICRMNARNFSSEIKLLLIK